MQNTQTPKNFFLQVGIFFLLYASAISFLVFLFSVIDDVFPNSLDYYNDSNSGIRFSISTIIVVFPLFVWLSRLYRNFIKSNPEIKEGKLRKWITYLTLFITGVTIAIDLIVLVNTFLGGEGLTSSFVLKIISVFVVSFSVFVFCIKDLNNYFDNNPVRSKLWLSIVSVLLISSIVFGFMIIGSPSKQRDVRLDNQRVNDLSNIQYQIVNYYQQKGQLPVSLDKMIDPLYGNNLPVDPESNASYTYSVMGKLGFKLCAYFKTDSTSSDDSGTNIYNYDMSENWKHGTGLVCFERTIDPDRYPMFNNK